jgi:hypothetical protein
MGFLETIGHRREPAPKLAPMTVPKPAPMPAPVQEQIWEEPRRSTQAEASVAWIAVPFAIAAIGAAVWLGISNLPAGAPPSETTPVDAPSAVPNTPAKQDSKRTPARRREVATSAVHDNGVSESATSEDGAEIAAETSAPPVEAAADVNTAESEEAPASSSSEPEALVAEDDFIYSNEGAGVVPPQLVTLGFAPPLLKGFERRTSTLELLISKSGTVERARVSSTPRNWEDAMLVSRAKTFQFVPAQRNGSPVRYRLIMQVETTP